MLTRNHEIWKSIYIKPATPRIHIIHLVGITQQTTEMRLISYIPDFERVLKHYRDSARGVSNSSKTGYGKKKVPYEPTKQPVIRTPTAEATAQAWSQVVTMKQKQKAKPKSKKPTAFKKRIRSVKQRK